jgi:hypothetical protein
LIEAFGAIDVAARTWDYPDLVTTFAKFKTRFSLKDVGKQKYIEVETELKSLLMPALEAMLTSTDVDAVAEAKIRTEVECKSLELAHLSVWQDDGHEPRNVHDVPALILIVLSTDFLKKGEDKIDKIGLAEIVALGKLVLQCRELEASGRLKII